MDDRLEVAQRRRVGEHDPPERRAVELPFGPPHRVAEARRDRLASAGSPGATTSRATTVGVDDAAPRSPEPARDCRLAAADRAGDRRSVERHGARSSSSSQASSADGQRRVDVRELARDPPQLDEVRGDRRVRHRELEVVLAQPEARQLRVERPRWRR